MVRPVCRLLAIIPDKMFITIEFIFRVHYIPNLERPSSFNEKMQWLKLNDRKSIYTQMADKYCAKSIVATKIGEEYIIPNLGKWNSFREIDFEKLPKQFVLKCTHDSGGVLVVRDKDILDIRKAEQFLEGHRKFNYFLQSREWPYKNIKPQIMAEEYMEDMASEDSLNVYKILTFNGEPRIIQAIKNDKTDHETIDYFDIDWNKLNLKQNHQNDKIGIDRPINLSKMLDLARTLAEKLPFIRIDFYEINGRIYFSEYTFYSDGGFAKFHPSSWDKELGDWIILSR